MVSYDTDCGDHEVGGYYSAVLEPESVFEDLLGLCAQSKLDAVLNERRLKRLDHLWIKLGEDILSELDDCGVNASLLKVLSKFDTDKARTNNCCRGNLLFVHELLYFNCILDVP